MSSVAPDPFAGLAPSALRRLGQAMDSHRLHRQWLAGRKGWRWPRLFFSLPKSASTNASRMLARIGRRLGYGGEAKPLHSDGRTGNLPDPTLRPEDLAELRQGELFHSHSFPDRLTGWMLDQVAEIRYVVWMRNPLDQLVSLLCHYRRRQNAVLHRYDYIAPLPAFSGRVDADLDALLASWYPLSAIRWLSEWSVRADRDQHAVFRYEDFIKSPVQTIAKAAEWLYLKPAPEDLLRDLAEQGGQVGHGQRLDERYDPEIYPRGYTAETGIWKRYLRPEHVEAYCRILRVAQAGPAAGSPLWRLYPELTDLIHDRT